jgi:hypothetical protein
MDVSIDRCPQLMGWKVSRHVPPLFTLTTAVIDAIKALVPKGREYAAT